MGGEYHRVATRCAVCSSFWTVAPNGDTPRCPCGGELLPVDTRCDAEKLPYIPMKPEPPKVKK